MATFNIKRGDSMPPLMIAMRVSGTGTSPTDPTKYWDFSQDDLSTEVGVLEANANLPGETHYVDFVMYSTPGVITSPSLTDVNYSQSKITGRASLYLSAQNTDSNNDPIWVLRYNWRAPHPLFDPAKGIAAQPNYYAGDTAVVGTYFGEFKIYYGNTGSGDVQLKHRTFPSTPGDQLIINILPDGNNILAGSLI